MPRAPIVIGGVEVRPGRRASVALPTTELTTQVPLAMTVEVVHGHRPGPVLFVCAALHGDEINGVEIIRRLLRQRALEHVHGTLLAVPIVNLLGFMARSRYLPDRRDLNRSFPGRSQGSLAARIAHQFMEQIVSHASHGVDLHTAAEHRDNFPQIRADLDDPELSRMARAFGVPVLINASHREGSLRQAAAARGVPVLTYEGGEALRFDPRSIRAGVAGVIGVMRELGMLRAPHGARRTREPVVARSSSWLRAPQSGILRSEVSLGQLVAVGQELATVAGPLRHDGLPVVASRSGVVIGRTNLPVVHEGDGLFNIGHLEGTKAVARTLDAFDFDAEESLVDDLHEES